jgi:hypothetical protein
MEARERLEKLHTNGGWRIDERRHQLGEQLFGFSVARKRLSNFCSLRSEVAMRKGEPEEKSVIA